MTLLFPTKAVPWTSTSNNNDLIGLFEIYSSDVFHYYNIKLFLNFIYFLTTDKVQQSTEIQIYICRRSIFWEEVGESV